MYANTFTDSFSDYFPNDKPHPQPNDKPHQRPNDKPHPQPDYDTHSGTNHDSNCRPNPGALDNWSSVYYCWCFVGGGDRLVHRRDDG